MTATTTRLDLLRAVLAEPDDDAPRLAIWPIMSNVLPDWKKYATCREVLSERWPCIPADGWHLPGDAGKK